MNLHERNPDAIGRALRSAGFPHDEVLLSSDASECSVSLSSGTSWTYENLSVLSQTLGTTDLSLAWEEGFSGSDATPGERDAVSMRIRWRSPT